MQQTRIKMLAAIFILCSTLGLNAQTNLTGRVYSNPNILAEKLKKEFKDAETEIATEREKTVKEFEKKKGRKPTEEEMKELDAKIKEAQATMNAISEGMKTSIVMTFKTDKDVVAKMEMKISDEALKKAGVGWAKRKLMKAALAIAPSTEKDTYIVKDNLVIIGKGKSEDIDTMRLSDDGKYLYGKIDDTEFKLTRTE